nr:hypothetical protein [Ardenticatena sp.]
MTTISFKQDLRLRLLASVLLLLLTKIFLGLGIADRLAATGPAPSTNEQAVSQPIH